MPIGASPNAPPNAPGPLARCVTRSRMPVAAAAALIFFIALASLKMKQSSSAATVPAAGTGQNVTCDPGWDPESGVLPANATAQAAWAKDVHSYAGSVETIAGGHAPWASGAWSQPLYAAGPLLEKGWKPFYQWFKHLPCEQHSPECSKVQHWKGCCHTHHMIKGKLIAFSDHMRNLGWPHWWVHAGTMLGLVREEGLLVPHDHDADLHVVAKFNGKTVFKDFTQRLLSFNKHERYAPYYILVGAHRGGGRGPWCKKPWEKGKCADAFRYHGKPEKFVAKRGDFMIGMGGHTSEFGHVDISLLRVKGAGYAQACQQTFGGNWMHPTWWTESKGLPAACPFGLKLGNTTYHGINCPDNVIAYLSGAYGTGRHGWQSREVKFSSEARWYTSEHWRSSDVGKAAKKAAAKLADFDDSRDDCFAVGGAGRRLGANPALHKLKTQLAEATKAKDKAKVKKLTAAIAALKKKQQKGYGQQHHQGCTCKTVKVAKSKPQVQCGRQHRAPSSTQTALDKLSLAAQATRGTAPRPTT